MVQLGEVPFVFLHKPSYRLVVLSKCSGQPPLPQAEEGTTNLEAGSLETGFPACWRASLDPNAGACVVFGLEAKNSLFLKEELGLPTCALKPTVVFMPATPAEGFLMVPGAAPLKNLAPVKGPSFPIKPLMAAMKLLPLEAAMMLLLLLPLETVTRLEVVKDMILFPSFSSSLPSSNNSPGMPMI